MMSAARQGGLTLLELAIVLAIAAVLVAVGLPDFDSLADKRRLQGAAQRLQQDVMLARTEAIKRNVPVSIEFSGDGDLWCYGVTTDTTACSCAVSGDVCACTNCSVDGEWEIDRNSGSYPEISVDDITFGSDEATFNPPNGTLTPGSVVFASEKGVEGEVRVSALGRVLVCSDTSGQKYGFQSCPP
jgi:prepilin-type N-terminal cleavage/methylation domain-containing protein